jgi:branched-chain amino acid transport system permease protein
VFTFAFMVSMIIMVLIGGKGTLVGPLVGALLVTLLEEYLREAKELRLSIFGLAVIAIVLFLPRGLMGFLAGAANAAQRRRTMASKAAGRTDSANARGAA